MKKPDIKHSEIIRDYCKSMPRKRDNDFERYLSESWFSNTLAWLLNPKESHGLGVRFANEFVKTIARKRSEGFRHCACRKNKEESEEYDYAHRASLLKWRRNKHKGKSSIGLSLKNACPICEFYLTRTRKEYRKTSMPSYIDVLFLDMDLDDGLVVAIENKLFTINHSEQLEYYYDNIEDKFSAATVREYVYLTLRGDPPVMPKSDDPKTIKKQDKEKSQWVCMSWLIDVHDILIATGGESLKNNPDLKKLMSVLNWLQSCCGAREKILSEEIRLLRKSLRETVAECLTEELERTSKEKTGTWKLKEKGSQTSNQIHHTSYPSRRLHINLLSNLTIAVEGHDSRGDLFEKVIVPFGCSSDQVYNLLDIAAKDIVRNFFTDSSKYVASTRRKRVLSPKKAEHKEFFDFVCEYATALQLLLMFP